MKKYLFVLTSLCLLIFFPKVVNASYLVENTTWQQNLTAVTHSSPTFGDIDNDGDLDLALIGVCGISCYIAKIYINNGTSLVENSTWQQNLTAVNYGSLAFGDIDNDADLDLALTGCSSGGGSDTCSTPISKIYINNGTSLVENSTWQQNLTNAGESSLEFGDIDNDGDLDLALTGKSAVAYVTKIYINNGTSLVENTTWQLDLAGIHLGDIEFGDIDNDGDLDLALTGKDVNFRGITKIYINNGTSLVENSTWQQNLVTAVESSLAFGDIDNDGDLDLSLIGCCDQHLIYNNTGTTFVEIETHVTEGGDLAGIFAGSLAWGDYDNDGDLDLITTGREGLTTLYVNDNSDFPSYSENPESNLPNLVWSSVTWVDLDDDGDLDLTLFGWQSSVFFAKVYTNNITTNNTYPVPPTSGFSSSFDNEELVLSWGNGSDVETSALGLYYNLRVGTSSAGNDVVSGVYGGSSDGGAGGGTPSGYFGNMMQRKSIRLKGLEPSTTYYWNVQTIDTALENSSWSTEQTYTTESDVTMPVITVNGPVDYYNTSNATITFNLTITDTQLSNVSLYGNWSGFHLNETNSSGENATYIFTKNLTSHNDGMYFWNVRSCDNKGNCRNTTKRYFTIDTITPNITFVSPTPSNDSTWSSSNSITINASLNESPSWCGLSWNSGNNESMTISGETCSLTKSSLSNALYNYTIWVNDSAANMNVSELRWVTVSYTSSSGNGNGGGGGGGTGTTTTTTNATTTKEELFDIDFSKVNNGIIEAKQGEIKTFSFNNEVGHKITISEILEKSVRLIIESDSIFLMINTGQTKQIDINQDNINDFEIKLISIINGKAKFSLTKLEGADIVAQEELEEAVRKEALFDVKVSIDDKYKQIFIGDEIIAKIEVFNINNIGQVDVVVDYYLSDSNLSNGTILAKGFDTLAVEAVTSFVRSLIVPEDTNPGTYYFGVDVSYKNFTTSSNTEFKVKSLKRKFIEERFKEIVISAIVLIAIFIFVYLWKIEKKEEKDISKMKRQMNKLKRGKK